MKNKKIDSLKLIDNLRLEPLWQFCHKTGPVLYGYEKLHTIRMPNPALFFKNLTPEIDFSIFLQHCNEILILSRNLQIFSHIHNKFYSIFHPSSELNKIIHNISCNSSSSRDLSRISFNINLNADTLVLHMPEIFRQISYIENHTGFKIYIEITEDRLFPDILSSLIKILQKFTVPIVIDDFGRGGANFDVIHKLKPKMVKIDISIIPPEIAEPIIHYFANSSFIEKIVFERIENPDTLLQLLSKFSGTKFLYQGFLLMPKKTEK